MMRSEGRPDHHTGHAKGKIRLAISESEAETSSSDSDLARCQPVKDTQASEVERLRREVDCLSKELSRLQSGSKPDNSSFYQKGSKHQVSNSGAKQGQGQSLDRGPSRCHNCGGRGHFAKECPSAKLSYNVQEVESLNE